MIQPYHFAKSPGKNFIDFYQKIAKSNGVLCFDFEDSINASDQHQTNLLKAHHRKTVINRLKQASTISHLSHIGFRINGSDTSFYQQDLAEINKLKNVHSIFLPKVEGCRQLENMINNIPDNVDEIIPIIETKKGFDRIDEILSIKNSNFFKIAFGHCDYNLSKGYFPFFHQDSMIYWEWVNQLAHNANRSGKQLINSPVLRLNDDAFFYEVLRKNKSYQNISGQVTLCMKQTMCCALTDSDFDSTAQRIELREDRLEYAKKLIESFEEYQVADRFFAIDKNRMLISPQEYTLAKSMLQKITA